MDETVADEGYITTVNLVGLGITATATTGISSGGVTEIFLNNDGSGFTSAPTISFSAAPSGGHDAHGVAITTERANVTSIYRIEMTNTGAGYTVAPTISISGGGGTGAAATCSISTTFGVQSVIVAAGSTGYSSTPLSTVTAPPTGINTAVINPVLEPVSGTGISTVRIINAGIGYTVAPTIVFSTPQSGLGTFYYGEVVTGQSSGITAVVRNFRKDTDTSTADPPTTLQISLNTGKFYDGEIVVGALSTATYLVKNHDLDSFDQAFDSNEDIETEADNILDFSEGNPFGDY